MLPISSSDLNLVATSLLDTASAQETDSSLRMAAWHSFLGLGNSAEFLEASFVQATTVSAARTGVAREMVQVASVLSRTAETVRAIEVDLDRVISGVDAATQNAESAAYLYAEIRALGRALDRACAEEIMALCTQQTPTSTSLTDFASSDLDEVHQYVLATSSQEVRALAQQFPDARLLPTSDGVALYFGDIETAPSVTTVIPGVGSASPNTWAGYATRTQAIANTMGGAGILWLDYRAPGHVATATVTHPAAVGGARLQQFQAELRRRAARKGQEPRLHVVAHSYGSVVAGHAAQGAGLNADSLIVVGSPGVGASHSSELDLHGDFPTVIAVSSPADPIGLVTGAVDGVHGPDPADPAFGASEVWPTSGGHSDYWDSPEFHRQLWQLAHRD